MRDLGFDDVGGFGLDTRGGLRFDARFELVLRLRWRCPQSVPRALLGGHRGIGGGSFGTLSLGGLLDGRRRLRISE